MRLAFFLVGCIDGFSLFFFIRCVFILRGVGIEVYRGLYLFYGD